MEGHEKRVRSVAVPRNQNSFACTPHKTKDIAVSLRLPSTLSFSLVFGVLLPNCYQSAFSFL